MTKKCEICNEDFLPQSLLGKYCSKQCRMKANNLKQAEYKQKWRLNSLGRTELIERTSKERWQHKKNGYILIKIGNELVYEHRVLAEEALGKPLPKGAVIHHTDKPWENHGPFKLVICPSQAYHMLLHKRAVELGYADN